MNKVSENSSDVMRFLNKVNKTNSCWEWKAQIGRDGYGVFSYKGKSRKAHRIAWFFEFGEIPEGYCICHKCDNKICVNPKHLFLGTQTENNLDRDRKRRTARGIKSGRYTKPERTARGQMNGRFTKPERTARGSSNGKSILNEEQIKKIKFLLANNKISQAEIGRIFGVSRSYICHIAHGRTWRHI